MKQVFEGIWQDNGKLLTKNLIPGFKSYSEKLLNKNSTEYRSWDPYRSKPAAAIKKGLKNFPIKSRSKILYLGIANGNTASFISDIIGHEGLIYGIDISERALRDLIPVAEKRGNIAPILASAREIGRYSWIEKVDIVYQDVATRDQTDIIIRNASAFLKNKGYAVMALKARSIDVIKNPREIYTAEAKRLSEHFAILEKIELEPFEKDHMFFVMRPKY